MKFCILMALGAVSSISVERITGVRRDPNHHTGEKKKDELDWLDPVPYVTNTDDHSWGSPLSSYSYNIDGADQFKKWQGPHLDYKVDVDYK